MRALVAPAEVEPDGVLEVDRPELFAATGHFRDFFAGRSLPGGAPAASAAPRTGDKELDLKVVLDRLRKVRDRVGVDYLAPSEGGAAGGGQWSVVRRPDDLWAVPLFHEVAPDVYWATDQLVGGLERGFADDEIELV